MFHQFRRRSVPPKSSAEAAIRLATEQGFPLWMAHGVFCAAGRWRTQGQAQEGIEQIHQGLMSLACDRSRDHTTLLSGTARRSPWDNRTASRKDSLLTEALALVDTTGERWYEAEMYRLKGALLLQQSSDNQTEAETCFHQAIDDSPKSTSQILRVTSRHQPRSPVAAARQTPGSP